MPRPRQLTKQQIERHWQPLATHIAAQIARWQAASGAPLLIGLSAAQGSGKSTLAALIAARLFKTHRLKAITISLDDFYLTAADRQHRANTIHPLFATRGVPGTHDLPLLTATLDALLHSTGQIPVPHFDKSLDDRAPKAALIQAPLDIVILEGWCLGAVPEPEASLTTPLNALEATEDPDALWRRHINHHLAADYAQLWTRLDKHLHLQAPDWPTICHWRAEAETARPGGPAMTPAELTRFMQHYERITRALLHTPPRADMTWTLDTERRIVE